MNNEKQEKSETKKEESEETKESSQTKATRKIVIETDGSFINLVQAQVAGDIELIAILQEVINSLKNKQAENAKKLQEKLNTEKPQEKK